VWRPFLGRQEFRVDLQAIHKRAWPQNVTTALQTVRMLAKKHSLVGIFREKSFIFKGLR
jgi:hypothetical protein